MMDYTQGKKLGVVGFFGFFSKTDEVSNEELVRLFRGVMDEEDFEVKGVYSAFGSRSKFLWKDGFQDALKACEAQDVDLLVINTVDVIGDNEVEILSFARNMKEKYGVNIYFIQEEIDSAQETFSFMLTAWSFARCIDSKRRKRRKAIREALMNLKEGTKPTWKISLSSPLR